MDRQINIVAPFIVAMLLCAPAWTQSVTVHSGGGADFTAVAAALDAVTTDAAEPNVITITGGGPYEEELTIGTPVTIQGQSATERPVILIRKQADSDDGIVNSAPVDMTFENLIFLPSLELRPEDDGFDIRPLSASDNFNVTLRNVLITVNNGANQPLSVDGLSLVPAPEGAVSFGDDGFQTLANFAGIPNGAVNVLIEDVVVTHINNNLDPITPGNNNDGFILGGDKINVTMRNTVASYCDRSGIQFLTNVTVNAQGTPDAPIICKGNGTLGAFFFSGTFDVSHMQFLDSPLGVRIDSDGTLSAVNADHLFIANCTEQGMAFLFPVPSGITRNHTITDSTFFNNFEQVSFRLNTTDRITVTLRDSIFAGLFEDGEDTFLFSEFEGLDPLPTTFANVNIENCAVVTEESSPLRQFFGFRDESITESGVITADPGFLSTDPGNADYLRASASAYAAAASDGGPLRGAFPFAGEPVPVEDWMMY